MFAKVAAVAGLVAFAGDPFALGSFYPGYHRMRHVQSERGTSESPVARWMNLSWVLFGGLCIWYSMGYAMAFQDGGASCLAAAWLIGVFGLGAGIGAELRPQEPGGAETTARGKLRGIFAGVGELAIIVVPFLNLSVLPRTDEPVLWWASVIGGVAIVAMG